MHVTVNDSPSAEWYEPADLIEDDKLPLDVDPILLNRPTAVLTPRGYAVLALIRQQDALPASDTTAREWIDREISGLLTID